jgi:hypothetical protein
MVHQILMKITKVLHVRNKGRGHSYFTQYCRGGYLKKDEELGSISEYVGE